MNGSDSTLSDELRRRVGQSLRTDRLFGVDFIDRAALTAYRAALDSARSSESGQGVPEIAVAAARVESRHATTTESARTASIMASSPSPVRRDRERSMGPAETASAEPTLPVALSPVGLSDDAAGRWERLLELQARHDRECPHCTTATAHRRTVFGEGNPAAALLFVGEAPGETEDQLGRPFVGRAGQKLDEIIAAMGLSRADTYIANVLKSRPPENRTPLRHEVEACGPYLTDQIRIVRPKVIVTLGGPATKLLLGVETGITRLRGVWSEFRFDDEAVAVMPTFHPAYLLRNYTPETRRQVWSDMRQVCERLGIEPRR